MVSPKCFVAITEHSICQPGRPLPQGESQLISPGLALFHSAKSNGFLFLASSALSVLWLAPTCKS